MQNKINFNKTTLFLIGIFLVYFISCFYVGSFHEPWADEAQAWLVARDCSIKDLIFNSLRYEGHPILWYLILKFVQIFHFPYDNINLISLFFGSLGVYLFLFKTKTPLFLKATIPFCYYIFYQYSVVSRNHCLIFPILMLISMVYPQKEKSIIKYSLLLILLASVSFHGYFISFILFIDFVISLFKKINFKQSVPVFIVLLNYILTFLYLNKPADGSFPASFGNIQDLFFMVKDRFSNLFFNVQFAVEPLKILLMSFVILFLLRVINTICINKSQKTLLYVLNFSFLGLLSIFYCNDWHLGYEFLVIVFSIVVMCNTNNIQKIDVKSNKSFYFFIIIVLISQLIWTVKSSIFEKRYLYSASAEVVKYLKENKFENNKIVGMNFHVIAVNPYFEKNIFSNTPYAYWYWRKDTLKDINFYENPIILFDKFGKSEIFENPDKYGIKEYINKNYDIIVFKANLISKGRFKEDLTLTLCVPKNKAIVDE